VSRTPRDRFHEVGARNELAFRYALVCAWEWSVDELLAGDPTLIPFVPYAGDASVQRVDEAIRTAQQLPRQVRLELLAALAVFAQNVFKDVDWPARMSEEELMENAIFKQGEAKGYERGEVAGERKLLARLLHARLESEAPRFVNRLELSTEAQLEAAADLLVAEQAREELIAALERVLTTGA